MTSLDLTSGFRQKGQGTAILVSVGHGASHWNKSLFFILLPYIQASLGLNYIQVSIFVTILMLGSIVANLTGSVAIDITGRRVPFQIIALVSGAVAMIAIGLTGSYWMICAMVIIIGAANFLWHPAAIPFLSDLFPDNKGYALSLHGIGASIGDMVSPFIAGLLLAWLGSWQQTAVISAAPIFVVVAALFIILLPKEKPVAGDQKKGINFSEYMAGLRSIIKQRAIVGLALMAGFRSTAVNTILMFVPLYLVNELNFSEIEMGSAMSIMQIGGLFAVMIAGILSDTIGRRPVIMFGLTFTTVMVVALIFVTDPIIYITSVAFLGFGMYSVRSVIHSWMMDITPPHMGASVTGFLFTVQSVMSSVTPIIGGLIADAYGIAAVFYFVAGMMLCANAATFLIPNPKSPASAAE